ncbi:S-adenosyl-L-methionine-dependent methyltransferase [Xylariales sp. AK1849]|nr:S-adenosyl-L-methionine-dependent methyltransferase [Xylariales sp. AK1849]
MPDASSYSEVDDSSSSNRIEAGDPDDIEDDEFAPSAFDVESFSAFESISPSVLRHSYENGRRYHKFRYGTYPIPNDDTEQARDEMKHAATLELTRGILCFAPIGNFPQRIIDLGTGTGAWAIEIADKYPSAQVIGLDLSPIQENWVPPNLRFIIEDIHDPWLHGDNFDLVHLRHVSLFLKNFESVVVKSFQHLRPGGWIECQEFGGIAKCDDGTMREGTPFARFMDKIEEAFSQSYGFQWRVANVMDDILIRNGFVNIGCKKFKAPIGRWPKNKKLRLVGEYMREITLDLIDAIAAKPLREIMPLKDIEELLTMAKGEIGDHSSHCYIDYFFWYAQKPANAA